MSGVGQAGADGRSSSGLGQSYSSQPGTSTLPFDQMQQLAAFPQASDASGATYSAGDALSAIHMPFDFGDESMSGLADTSSMAPPPSTWPGASAVNDAAAAAAASSSAAPTTAKPNAKTKQDDPQAKKTKPRARKKKTQAADQSTDDDALATSRRGSVAFANDNAPATPDRFDTSSMAASRAGSVTLGTGESTPTKRGRGRGGSAAAGRGGRGAASKGGRKRGAMASRRTGSHGSRATSGRLTASVAPGDGTAAPDDSIAAGGARADGDEDGDGNVDEDDVDMDGDSDDDSNAGLGLEEEELARQETVQRQRSINMGPLMQAMTPEQQDRYSAFRRHFLDKRFVKRLIMHLTRQSVTPLVTTLIAGAGKVFIGEIVEEARRVRAEGPGGGNTRLPLQPDHLIEAFRRYREPREKPGRYPIGAPTNLSAGVAANGKRRRMF